MGGEPEAGLPSSALLHVADVDVCQRIEFMRFWATPAPVLSVVWTTEEAVAAAAAAATAAACFIAAEKSIPAGLAEAAVGGRPSMEAGAIQRPCCLKTANSSAFPELRFTRPLK